MLTDPAKSPEERRAALVRWATLPEARFAQPREEHLLPLHVVRTYIFYAGPDLGYRRGGLQLLGAPAPLHVVRARFVLRWP